MTDNRKYDILDAGEGAGEEIKADDEIAIRVKNLSKCYPIFEKPRDRLLQMLVRGRKRFYRQFWALRDVSFEVKKGETVGIIGRNGSGKSTLLQMICGTLTPTAGTVEVNGRVAALLELGAGFNPEFTGRENVYMSGTVLGLSKNEIDARFDEIAAFADIGDFIEQPVKTYSSGMYVRLAFAVIVHVDADILIIDEALAVGDAFFTQKCMRFLRRFRETGTVLFVSHDSGAVVNLCNRALWLGHGEVKMAGGAKEVCEAYQEAVFETQHGPSVIGKITRPVAASTARSEKTIPILAKPPVTGTAVGSAITIEQFRFDPDQSAFGAGGAVITDVRMLDAEGKQLSRLVQGGEPVTISIHCRAEKSIVSPIVGFFVKDRLGQTLFGDNTYLSYLRSPFEISMGQMFSANFEFALPLLPGGDYSICAAVAEGTQADHVQHHWIHDALIFRVNSNAVQCGLVGIPMNSIRLLVEPDSSSH